MEENKMTMQQGAAELAREVRNAEDAGLRLVVVPTDSARLTVDYVTLLENASRAQRTNKELDAIDNALFVEKLFASSAATPAAGQAGLATELYYLLEYIENEVVRAEARRKLAAALAAPVAADTEQASDAQAVKTWPERIWLQHGCDEVPHYAETVALSVGLEDGITWWQDSINAFDIEYVRADLACDQALEEAAKVCDWHSEDANYGPAISAAKKCATAIRALKSGRAAPLATPADAGAGQHLTEADILAALGTTTHEVPKRLPPGWLKFARAIESKVLARLSTPGAPDDEVPICVSTYGSIAECEKERARRAAPVTAEPVAWRWNRLDHNGKIVQHPRQDYPCKMVDMWSYTDDLKVAAELRGERGYTANPSYTNWQPLYATPAPADRDAIRDQALVVAEAALSDIGDADREPGDDLAWCEVRAAKALPEVRAALALKSMERAADAKGDA